MTCCKFKKFAPVAKLSTLPTFAVCQCRDHRSLEGLKSDDIVLHDVDYLVKSNPSISESDSNCKLLTGTDVAKMTEISRKCLAKLLEQVRIRAHDLSFNTDRVYSLTISRAQARVLLQRLLLVFPGMTIANQAVAQRTPAHRDKQLGNACTQNTPFKRR